MYAKTLRSNLHSECNVRVAIKLPDGYTATPMPEREDGHLRTMGVAAGLWDQLGQASAKLLLKAPAIRSRRPSQLSVHRGNCKARPEGCGVVIRLLEVLKLVGATVSLFIVFLPAPGNAPLHQPRRFALWEAVK